MSPPPRQSQHPPPPHPHPHPHSLPPPPQQLPQPPTQPSPPLPHSQPPYPPFLFSTLSPFSPSPPHTSPPTHPQSFSHSQSHPHPNPVQTSPRPPIHNLGPNPPGPTGPPRPFPFPPAHAYPNQRANSAPSLRSPESVIARMHERQSSWQRQARENSATSAASGSGSTTSASRSSGGDILHSTHGHNSPNGSRQPSFTMSLPTVPAGDSGARRTSSSSSPSTTPVAYPPTAGPSSRPMLERSKSGQGSTGNGTSNGSGSGKEKGARKKVAKACLACQKSHLTCDERRPCTRCVKKGIGEQCVEGVRKKAKYLLEGEERDQLGNHPSHPRKRSTSPRESPTSSSPFTTVPLPLPPLSHAQQQSHTQNQPQQPSIPTISGNPSPTSGSMAAPPIPLSATAPVPAADVWLTAPMVDVQPMGETMGEQSRAWDGMQTGGGLGSGQVTGMAQVSGNNQGGFGVQPTQSPNDPFAFTSATANSEYEMFDSLFGTLSPTFPMSDLSGSNLIWNNYALPDQSQSQPSSSTQNHQSLLQSQPMGSNMQAISPLSMNPSADTGFTPPTQLLQNQNQPQYGNNEAQAWVGATIGPTCGPQGNSTAGPSSTMTGQGQGVDACQTPVEGTGHIYHADVRPYNYQEGYHYLMQYLAQNYEKAEILRVVRALAAYRPSLIALQVQMSEEDEVFLERSFQRTLLELEKLIGHADTPTLLWRRTGEIVYASPHFCTLVGKSSSELVSPGTKTYFYQLLSKQSTLEYWENFSVHAFENTTQNFYQSLSFVIGDKTVACASCITIRRDVFDLPSVVIGQFLPIPQNMNQ